MLVITQRENDSFEIITPENKTIKIIFLKHKQKQIRLGVVADDDVRIERHNRYLKGEKNEESSKDPIDWT